MRILLADIARDGSCFDGANRRLHILTTELGGEKFQRQKPWLAGYHAVKHAVVGLMRYYATSLAAHRIRVNTVHPTGVATPMLVNEGVRDFFATHPEAADGVKNALPVDLIEAADVTEAIVLCGPGGRYVTGTAMSVDAACHCTKSQSPVETWLRASGLGCEPVRVASVRLRLPVRDGFWPTRQCQYRHFVQIGAAGSTAGLDRNPLAHSGDPTGQQQCVNPGQLTVGHRRIESFGKSVHSVVA